MKQQPKETEERLAYSVIEAARATGFSVSSLYKYASEGRLIFQKQGARTFITREELVRFLKDAPTVVPTQRR